MASTTTTVPTTTTTVASTTTTTVAPTSTTTATVAAPTTTKSTTTSTTTQCLEIIITPWMSHDVPYGDGGTGDHELIKNINPCGYNKTPIQIEIREKTYHLPYFVRNIVFHKKKRGYSRGPSRSYGFR